MKHLLIGVWILAAATAASAGDLWEFSSQSSDPDGKAIPHAERKCLPAEGTDPAKLMDGLGACSYDRKSGTSSHLTFVMTCKTPGMPAALGAMKVAGDAKLSGSEFDMRYTITVGDPSAPGADFKMTGTLTGRKVGTCNL